MICLVSVPRSMGRVKAEFMDHENRIEVAGFIARPAPGSRCHAQRGA
jgi:hypothetical protein